MERPTRKDDVWGTRKSQEKQIPRANAALGMTALSIAGRKASATME